LLTCPTVLPKADIPGWSPTNTEMNISEIEQVGPKGYKDLHGSGKQTGGAVRAVALRGPTRMARPARNEVPPFSS